MATNGQTLTLTNLGDAGTLFSKDDKPLSISATRWHAYRYTQNSSTNSVVLKDFWSCENHCTNLTACSTLNETAIPCPVKHAAACERVSMTVPLCGDSKSKVKRWPIPKFSGEMNQLKRKLPCIEAKLSGRPDRHFRHRTRSRVLR